LGLVYQKQGRFQKALAAYKKASDMNSFSMVTTYNVAQTYLHFGTIGKSLPVFEALLKKFPQDLEYNSAVASAHLLKGDFPSAIAIYESLPKDAFSRPQFGLNYAVALKFAGKNEEAKSIFAKVAPSTGDLKEYAQKVENFIRN
jgi:tetratricopeptide (TPR) repeat protein